jgi:hypothetical protein
MPIVVHLHFIWSSSSRLFAEDRFTKLAPVHELGKFQRDTLLLMALSTSDTEERVNLDRRRRRGVAKSSAGTWAMTTDALGLFLLPKGRSGCRFVDAGGRGHQGGILQFILTTEGTAAPPLLHQCTGVKVDGTGIRHWKGVLGEKKP